jgi:conjugal transfer mating pair stabilization protein TraN
MLAMHRDANLCVLWAPTARRVSPLSRPASNRLSPTAASTPVWPRIINEQGRGQVGKTWGSGENPDCSGFTTAEFEQLDFSRIDMSEFIQEVASSVRMPDVSSFGQNVQTTVQQRVNSYYNR